MEERKGKKGKRDGREREGEGRRSRMGGKDGEERRRGGEGKGDNTSTGWRLSLLKLTPHQTVI